MSKTIFDALVAGGLSPIGACAVMGNMDAESTMVSYRLQGDMEKGYPKSKQYTNDVDNGVIGVEQFSKDQHGYGLCQWTFPSRKKELLEFAKARGVSVGDELMQCEFCLHELKRDFADLYQSLCIPGDMDALTDRFCEKFERPAVNNYKARREAANEYYSMYCIPGAVQPQPTSAEETAEPKQKISFLDGILGLFGYKKVVSTACDQKTWLSLAKRMPKITYGSNSDAVKAMQCMLNVCGAKLDADGDWGDLTEAAFQKYKGGAV